MMTASIALAAELQRQAHPNAAAFLAATPSLMRVAGQRRRYWEITAAVRVPVLLIGGEADRLVSAARNPRWRTRHHPRRLARQHLAVLAYQHGHVRGALYWQLDVTGKNFYAAADVSLPAAGLWEIDPATDWKARARTLYDIVFTGLKVDPPADQITGLVGTASAPAAGPCSAACRYRSVAP